MPFLIFLFIVTLFLAYSNGANDNFKGVATLFGSQTTNFRRALWWATITTFLGSISSIFIANALVKNFSGKGIVPDSVAVSPEFLIAVALGAGLTVIFATVLGFPISTTHSLTGALIGSGVVATSMDINFAAVGNRFFLPLLVSPVIAFAFASILHAAFKAARVKMGISKEMCICIGETEQVVLVPEPALPLSFAASNLNSSADIAIDTQENCTYRYGGNFLGISVQKGLDTAHFMSAGIVSFARGLNDTPKIVALIFAVSAFGISYGMIAVALGMAAGGLLNAKKVAETMSVKITSMTHGQGFTANIVTGILVVAASRFGMPVSTTHVSVGSIFGIGLVSKQANSRIISEILLSWVLTLPVAALLSAGIYWLITAL